ncbi:MAG TPA: amidohydrolase family protein [Acidimicrobiia bacterium]|nr:amidohydrolase family protein [Acidimicrobiia bacterium]
MTIRETGSLAMTSPSIDVPWIVSVDDHVIEPPGVWTSRLPARYRDAGPHVERLPAGGLELAGARYLERPGTDGPLVDYWVYEDLYFSLKRAVTAVGRPRSEVTMTATTYDDVRPGCYDSKERLADMNVNWTQASLSFPNFPRFCGQTFLEAKDREVARLCVDAYNDWMVEEWCAGSDGRLVPLCIVPLWDPQLAADEVRRNAARGVRAVCFSEIPAYLGLPSIHSGDWDPFFAACQETGTVVCLHIGSGTKMPSTSADAPLSVAITIGYGNCMNSLADWLFSGKLAQFPGLRLLYAESQIGWIPYLLERADDVWQQHHSWVATGGEIDELPSTYYYRQVYACFFRDYHGVESLKSVGTGNVMFEVDYPHSDSTWPDSRAVAADIMAGLPAEVVHKLVRGNAIRVFGLDDLPDSPET